MENHPGYLEIKLTPAEASLWDWAVDPMQDYWHEETSEQDPEEVVRFYEVDEAICLAKDGIGRIANDPDVADDLIYRVTTQMFDMSITEIRDNPFGSKEYARAVASVQSGVRIMKKIWMAFGKTEL